MRGGIRARANTLPDPIPDPIPDPFPDPFPGRLLPS